MVSEYHYRVQMIVSGCPTAGTLDSAVAALGGDFQVTAEDIYGDETSLPLPFSTLDEAKGYITDNCVNATTDSANICVSELQAEYLTCAFIARFCSNPDRYICFASV
jgi:hypothetical protein